MQSTISDLAFKMWRFWQADTSEYMPKEVFYEYIAANGFSFKPEVAFDNTSDENLEAVWHVSKYGDVEDAFIEHINSVKAFDSLAHFTAICKLYIEPVHQHSFTA